MFVEIETKRIDLVFWCVKKHIRLNEFYRVKNIFFLKKAPQQSNKRWVTFESHLRRFVTNT